MTSIEWTDETWNPIVGCSLESPGCTNCYAMRMAFRLDQISRGKSKSAAGLAHYQGLTKRVNGARVWTGLVKPAPEKLYLKPLTWKKPKTIFVNSMGDLFHESIPEHEIDKVFAIMALCPQHTFQILTKRAERMRDYAVSLMECEDHFERVCDAAVLIANSPCAGHVEDVDLPLKNVWLGVSAGDQTRADTRIQHLLATPAAKRFISAEPLLGPIDLTPWLHARGASAHGKGDRPPEGAIGAADERAEGLDWIITGGESGPGARPPHPEWFRDLQIRCESAGIPFFFKQWGSWAPVADPVHCDIAPEQLRIVKSFEGCDISEEVLMANLGKSKTGATLDGRVHREFPA